MKAGRSFVFAASLHYLLSALYKLTILVELTIYLQITQVYGFYDECLRK
jgi:hypothetical protein